MLGGMLKRSQTGEPHQLSVQKFILTPSPRSQIEFLKIVTTSCFILLHKEEYM
jgi:hypothetical protein